MSLCILCESVDVVVKNTRVMIMEQENLKVSPIEGDFASPGHPFIDAYAWVYNMV